MKRSFLFILLHTLQTWQLETTYSSDNDYYVLRYASEKEIYYHRKRKNPREYLIRIFRFILDSTCMVIQFRSKTHHEFFRKECCLETKLLSLENWIHDIVAVKWWSIILGDIKEAKIIFLPRALQMSAHNEPFFSRASPLPGDRATCSRDNCPKSTPGPDIRIITRLTIQLTFGYQFEFLICLPATELRTYCLITSRSR